MQLDKFTELLVTRPYVQRLSVLTDNFKQKKSGLWNCSCPLHGCGDNLHNKSRARMFIYEHDSTLITKCHNCGASMSFKSFLKIMFQGVYKELIFDLIRESSRTTAHKSVAHELPQDVKKEHNHYELKDVTGCIALSKLNNSHEAVIYANSRKIPRHIWHELFYTDNFYEFGKKYDKSMKRKYFNAESRLIIPYTFNGELVGFTGRALNAASAMRYVNVVVNDSLPKIYGIDRVNINAPYLVFEGQIDSMMLENSIAVGTSKLTVPFVAENSETAILIPDNEPRSPIIVHQIKKYIDSGYNVWLFPKSYQYKDMNAGIMAGYDKDSFREQIISGAASGARALLNLADWRKC
jgi:hypothetical protein